MRSKILGLSISLFALISVGTVQSPGPGGADCAICAGINAKPPSGPGPADPCVPQRVANQEAFDQLYLAQKETLMANHAGDWVAILGGKLLPKNDQGNTVPASTLEALLAGLAAPHQKVHHRFIFRVGEEGLIRYHPTINEHSEWIGASFLGSFKGGVWITPEGVYVTPRGNGIDQGTNIGAGLSHAKGPRAELWIHTPNNDQKAPINAVVSTGFEGHSVIGRQVAASLGLSMWEIPGELDMGFDLPLRRSRARFETRAGDFLDVLAPVGIWADR